MAKRNSMFSDDWRDCLEEHYKDVVRRNDTLTERTLTGVMHDVGFDDDALRDLKLHATMRAEDLDGDFVPDLDLGHDHSGHDHSGHTHSDHDHAGHDHAEEEAVPTVFAGVDLPTPSDAEPVVEVVEPDSPHGVDELSEQVDMVENETPDEPDPDAPQQMSMF